MKKVIIWLLLAIMTISLVGCSDIAGTKKTSLKTQTITTTTSSKTSTSTNVKTTNTSTKQTTKTSQTSTVQVVENNTSDIIDKMLGEKAYKINKVLEVELSSGEKIKYSGDAYYLITSGVISFYTKLGNENGTSSYETYYKNGIFYGIKDGKAEIDYHYQATNNIFQTLNLKDTLRKISSTTFQTKEYEDYGVITGDNEINLLSEVNSTLGINEMMSIFTYGKSSLLTLNFDKNQNIISSITNDLSMFYYSYIPNLVSLNLTMNFEYGDFSEVEPPNLQYEDKGITAETGKYMEMYVIEMLGKEYGDAIFFKSGNFEMLVDAGTVSDSQNINSLLQEKVTDKELDVVIVTHPHSDHYGGYSGNKLLNGIESIGLFIDYGYEANISYESIRNEYVEAGAKYCTAYESVNNLNGCKKKIQISDDLSLETLDTGLYKSPTEERGDDDNANSVVSLLTFGEITYLLTGDMNTTSDVNLINNENLGEVTIYKVAHHGASAYNCNSQKLINAISPRVALISAARSDTDKTGANQMHPTNTVVNRLLNSKYIKNTKDLYLNLTMGTIRVLTDGKIIPSYNQNIDYYGTSVRTIVGTETKKGYYYNGSIVRDEETLRYIDTKLYQARN